MSGRRSEFGAGAGAGGGPGDALHRPRAWFALALLALGGVPGRADLAALATLDGASGYEGPVLEYVRQRAGGRQEIDNTGSLTATFGSGRPHTLLIAGLDEPGYVVSGITDAGYLRVQRLGVAPPHPAFDSFFRAQPVRVTTASGRVVNGVVAALSVHLQADRNALLRSDSPEMFYLDVGARSHQEAREAGLDLLDPVTLEKAFVRLGGAGRVSAPWISGRAGAALLLSLARRLAAGPPRGSVTLGFVAQQYGGHRGLARLAERVEADRVLWLKAGSNPEPDLTPETPPSAAPVSPQHPAMLETLLALAEKRGLKLERGGAPRLEVPAFAPESIWKRPERVAVLTLGAENSGTPVEVVALPALEKVEGLLAEFAGITAGAATLSGAAPATAPAAPPASTLETLLAVYGVSGREAPVRRAIQALLPDWAREAARIDARGNLVIRIGERPERLFLAHMDELGYRITAIGPDGRLTAETSGGSVGEFSEWHDGFVQTEKGVLPALLVSGTYSETKAWVEVGATSAAEVTALGVKLGDTFALRKSYRPLLGGRVNARSLDDRVGCAVLLDALRSLKREEIRPGTWFAFVVEEEIGLLGSAFLSGAVKPREVYPLDTFVSSDSPLESPRLALARLGEGFVVRAIDSSGLTPRAEVRRVVELARRLGIPVQYGVTAGANDGSQFVAGGAVNVPLSWPLRYSHSPAEVADTADLEALRRIVRALVTNR